MPISKLTGLHGISDDAEFLVSQYSVSSDSLYYQVQTRYDNVEQDLSTDVDLDGIRLSAGLNRENIAAVSGSFEVLSNSIGDFAEKFAENESTTRKLPHFIDETEQYETQVSDVLFKDVCVWPVKDGNGVFELDLFAKNQIETGDSLVKAKIPAFRPGFSRHLYIILRNLRQTTLVFTSDERQEFLYGTTVGEAVPPGTHVLDVKEVGNGRFYVVEADVAHKVEDDGLVPQQ